MVDIIRRLAQFFPHLKYELRVAHIKDRPDVFIRKMLRGALLFSVALLLFLFFVFEVAGVSLWWLLAALPLLFLRIIDH